MSYQPKKAFFGKHVFAVTEEVYEPAEDTFLLADNLFVNEGELVLDMGTGCGILAILAAEKADNVVAVDINPHAIVCANKNAKLNGVAAKVETRLGDLFYAIKADEKFDLILFNAPYLPSGQDKGKSWIEKAWMGGKTGRAVIDRFISESSQYLTENGRILLIQSSLSNIEETLERSSQCKLHAEIVHENKLAFEKISLIEIRKKQS